MSLTDDADLPASVPMQDHPPGPADSIDLVENTWGAKLVIFHPDERRMDDEWLESKVYVDTADCR